MLHMVQGAAKVEELPVSMLPGKIAHDHELPDAVCLDPTHTKIRKRSGFCWASLVSQPITVLPSAIYLAIYH